MRLPYRHRVGQAASACEQSRRADAGEKRAVTKIIIPILILAMAQAAPALAQTYYKWTDDQGIINFTAQPPQDREYEVVDTSGQVVGQSAPWSRQQTEEAEGEQQVEMPRQREPDPEVVSRRCAQYRENLFWLQSNRRVYVDHEDGTREFVGRDEQQQRIEELEGLIAEWCQGVD